MTLARSPARPSLTRQTDRERRTACGMMSDELISEAQKAARHVANPAQLTAGRCAYLSLLVCTYLFIAVFLIPCSFCLSFIDSLTVSLLLFLSSSLLHSMCISVLCMCREALVHHSHISSVKPLHSPLPLIKPQMTQAITLNTVT